MNNNFWEKVAEHAYFNFLNREQANAPGNPDQDWDIGYREEGIEERIREEAYLHYLNGNNNPVDNWINAKNEIIDRLNFLAFYKHESNINTPPLENWIEAQRLYLSKF